MKNLGLMMGIMLMTLSIFSTNLFAKTITFELKDDQKITDELMLSLGKALNENGKSEDPEHSLACCCQYGAYTLCKSINSPNCPACLEGDNNLAY